MVLKPSFSDNINCGEIYRTNRKQSIQNYIKVCLNENICLKTEYFYCPETMVREAFIQYLQKMGMLFFISVPLSSYLAAKETRNRLLLLFN